MHSKDIQRKKKKKNCLHNYLSETPAISYRKTISSKSRTTWNN